MRLWSYSLLALHSLTAAALGMDNVGEAVAAWLHSSDPPQAASSPPSTRLYLPAIGVKDGKSVPECWAIQPNFTIGTDPSILGTLGVSLGNVSTAGYIYFPDDNAAPLHGPGANQYVIFLTGRGVISFPDTKETIDCGPGTNLVVVDNSTVSQGHLTNWTAGSSVITVRFKDTIPPPHEVVARSFCD
ncbi:hypothetical protein BCR35DRAFT_350778 [Leucosporidium creatinivorum]|uniref:RmlC-like cupin domain-containing protein n=1 Tax=Leucosporidium creatinivorum TaxID=106004 RepID=A0A1Y2FXT0_9BASI|nr:hypothetical protein BCR35DRAFT_350778 [Leucosporidium creatinivorum]